MPPAPPKNRKLAVLGSRAVGKSCLTIQYVENHFAETYYPTIEATFTRKMTVNNQEFLLEIIDTAGHDEYSLFNTKHAVGIHGYVLAYSITNRNSFELIKLLRDKILNYCGMDWVPIVIVGNKSDLPGQRQVSREEAQALAAEWKCQWIEASAKLNQNVSKIFELLIQEIEKSSGDAPPEPPKECVIL